MQSYVFTLIILIIFSINSTGQTSTDSLSIISKQAVKAYKAKDFKYSKQLYTSIINKEEIKPFHYFYYAQLLIQEDSCERANYYLDLLDREGVLFDCNIDSSTLKDYTFSSLDSTISIQPKIDVSKFPILIDNAIIEKAVQHPNKKTWYFSINWRGGFGGTDIYYTTLENNEWTAPRNLGPRVNKMGDEFPLFVSTEGELYFISNNLKDGYGGFDIYCTAGTGEFRQVHHLPYPFNTRFNDIDYFFDNKTQSGFFKSQYKDNTSFFKKAIKE